MVTVLSSSLSHQWHLTEHDLFCGQWCCCPSAARFGAWIALLPCCIGCQLHHTRNYLIRISLVRIQATETAWASKSSKSTTIKFLLHGVTFFMNDGRHTSQPPPLFQARSPSQRPVSVKLHGGVPVQLKLKSILDSVMHTYSFDYLPMHEKIILEASKWCWFDIQMPQSTRIIETSQCPESAKVLWHGLLV